MLHTTRGIVFKNVKYSETSVITTLYTEKFGVQTYMINGVRSSRSKIKNTMLQPLTLLNLVVYHRENKNIQRISEVGFNYVFQKLPFEIIRSSIGLFIIEILNKSIKEEEANPDLFEFIYNWIRQLDQQTEHLADYHLYFLLQLSRQLGFFPGPKTTASDTFFDMREGNFTALRPSHPNFIEGDLADYIHKICYSDNYINITKKERRLLIANIITYYELHIPNFPRINSYNILESVLQ